MTAPLLLHVFPSFAVGGAQVRFTTVANHFGAAYRHAIIAMDTDLACRARLAPGLDVTFPVVEARKRDMLGNLRRFRRLLRELRPDVLVTSNWGSIEWAMANAWPIARHVHIEDGFGPEERTHQLPRRVLTRRVVLRRSTVILPSRTLLQIATETWRLPKKRLRYIPNGIDLAAFAATANDAAVPWPNPGGTDSPVIGTVAALRPEKNIGRLLHALRRLVQDTPARLVIVGDGPERPALEALARELGVADLVTFTGYMAQPQRAYRHFDLFALSSDTEQMPLTLLEAMAARLAVAATDVGDIRTILAEENRPFVTPLDDGALADGLRALLRQPDLRQHLAMANRARVEQEFDQAVMLQAYAEILNGTAPRKRPVSESRQLKQV